MAPEGLDAVALDVGANEASDLLVVDQPDLLDARGWDWALWAVLDDVPVEDGIAICGHRSGAGPGDGWEVEKVRCKPLDGKGRTDDSEACARHDGYVYVFGSHFGSKDGPLERARQFIARFDEREAGRQARGGKLVLEISRNKFLLHRLVNDALADFGPDLAEIDPEVQDQVVAAARREGEDKDKRWADRIRTTDFPLNIEGADFRDDGSLLLGLRYPTTAAGQPLAVEVSGIQGAFDGSGGDPEVVAIHVLDGIGTPEVPEGVRAMRIIGGELHALTGNLDSQDKGSILIGNHSEAARATCTHVVSDVPAQGPKRRTRSVRTRPFREFEQLRRVEGIATDPAGRFWYVSDDEDAVVLRYFDG